MPNKKGTKNKGVPLGMKWIRNPLKLLLNLNILKDTQNDKEIHKTDPNWEVTGKL